MTSDTPGVLIVGAGSIGSRHARNATEHASVWIVDRDAARRNQLATAVGGESVASLDEGLARGPAAVVVATPHDTHLDFAKRALDAGAAVLIEKPLSHSWDNVEPFLELLEKTPPCFVVANMRFHPGLAALSQHIELIGRPLVARAHFGSYLPEMRPDRDYRSLYCGRHARGGGALLDGIHEVDYLTWFLGPAESVVADLGHQSDLEIESEDCASLVLRHRAGIVSEVHIDYLQRFKRRGCELIGSDGTVVWESLGKAPEQCTVTFYGPDMSEGRELFRADSIDHNEAYMNQMKHFLDVVLDRATPHPALLTVRHAAHALAVALAGHQAFETGRRTAPVM